MAGGVGGAGEDVFEGWRMGGEGGVERVTRWGVGWGLGR